MRSAKKHKEELIQAEILTMLVELELSWDVCILILAKVIGSISKIIQSKG
jgi:hypothetical protein